MKRYIIDGYNLLNSPAFGAPLNLDLENQRNHLIRLVKSYSHYEQSEVIIIFDNSLLFKSAQNMREGMVQVKFTSPSMEADELIKILIRQEKKPAELTIVSSDRAIQYAAKDHGAGILSSEDYCRLMEKQHMRFRKNPQNFSSEKYDPNLSEKELQYWKRLFEQDEDE